MRVVTVGAIALASVGSFLYFMPGETNAPSASDQLTTVTKIATNRGAPPASSAEPKSTVSANGAVTGQPRVFSPDRPLTGQALLTPVAPAEKVVTPIMPAPVTSFIAPVTAKPADVGQRKLSSSRPADDDARRELVRDLSAS